MSDANHLIDRRKGLSLAFLTNERDFMDTVEQVKGYFYKGYWNLKPDELWGLIFIDAMSQHLDIEASAIVMILSGQGFIPTRTKPGGTITGTSVASIVGRYMMPHARLPIGIRIPTPMGKTLAKTYFSKTNKVSVIITRYLPYIGWGIAVWYAYAILRDTKITFDRIISPKDRIKWTYF